MLIPSYPWLEFVDFRAPKAGEIVISPVVGPQKLDKGDTVKSIHLIAKIANAYDVHDLANIFIPEGYEPDGPTLRDAWRKVTKDDNWIDPASRINVPMHGWLNYNIHGCYRLCIRPVKPKTKALFTIRIDQSKVGCSAKELHNALSGFGIPVESITAEIVPVQDKKD